MSFAAENRLILPDSPPCLTQYLRMARRSDRLKSRCAPVAQWIEHIPPKNGVTRSIRVGGANNSTRRARKRWMTLPLELRALTEDANHVNQENEHRDDHDHDHCDHELGRGLDCVCLQVVSELCNLNVGGHGFGAQWGLLAGHFHMRLDSNGQDDGKTHHRQGAKR